MINLPQNPKWDIARVSHSTLVNADCFDVFPFIEDKSIDAIICDLPYGTTQNKWDSVLPLNKLWTEYNRILKDNGVIVLFGSEPFSSVLRMSNIKNYKYDWIWDKQIASGHLNVKIMPMKQHEIISVFSNGKSTYNRQFGEKELKDQRPNKYKRLQERNEIRGLTIEESKVYGKKTIAYADDNDDTKVNPKSILSYKKPIKKENVHPTQKSLELMEYLVKTYTNEGDMVLDNTMGSGTTNLASIKLNRKSIGIEKEKQYYDVAVRRLYSYCG